MKNTFKILLATLLFTGLWSCEDEQDLIFSTPPTGDFSILTPDNGGQVILNKDLPDNIALTLSWDNVSFGQTPTLYDVEMVKEADTWDTPMLLGTGYNNSNAIYTVAELNEKANMLGLAPDVLGAVKIRIKAYVGISGEPKYSQELVYLIQPYLAYFFRDLFLVGPASSAGWNNDNNNLAMFRSPDNENEYTYTGYLAGDALKLLEKMGAWQPQWGSQDGQLTSNPLHQSNDPDVINISGGLVTFTANTNSRAFSVSSYTGSVNSYSVVGIIGAGIGGWGDADQIDMTQAQVNGNNTHVWYARNVNVVGGEVKFRANNGWAVNWGGSTEFSGTGTQDGPNIPVSAGVYNVYFYSLTGNYMFIPVQE